MKKVTNLTKKLTDRDYTFFCTFLKKEKKSSGIDFINNLRAAFSRTEPNVSKRQSSHRCLFVLLESLHAKAACKTLVKFTHGNQFVETYSINEIWSSEKIE